MFSTLHTNDAASAFTRLIDMGVEPYLVASTVEGVMAQRLVRRLCKKCKEPFKPSADDLPKDFPNKDIDQIFRPVGCRECQDTGYAGRLGIFELLPTTDEVREMCGERVSATKVRRYAMDTGMISLRQCGWMHVMKGMTSIEDVVRTTKGDLI